MGNLLCTEPCLTDCPQGWACKQIQLSGTDLVFACVSDFVHLCQPCRTHADCETGEFEDVCVDYGSDAAFCGSPCEEESDCPAGFECVNASHVSGGESMQCTNVNMACDCSETAIKLGLATRCIRSNDYGICTGERQCTADGLQNCDAPEPSEEVCNGVDDNCNGTIDENAVDATNWYFDGDGDGFGLDSTEASACQAPSNLFVDTGGDCNDTAAHVNPQAPEVCDGETD